MPIMIRYNDLRSMTNGPPFFAEEPQEGMIALFVIFPTSLRFLSTTDRSLNTNALSVAATSSSLVTVQSQRHLS